MKTETCCFKWIDGEPAKNFMPRSSLLRVKKRIENILKERDEKNIL